MCFGMGILLTEEEWEMAAPITRSCFAALGLVNDYFSFDIEWDEYQREGKSESNAAMTNLVWLYMQWDSLSIPQAKEKTRETVRQYEAEYHEKVNAFTSDQEKCSINLARYLKAQAYQISGNVAWSLRCPRYHPELCSRAQDILDAQAQENKEDTQENSGSTKSFDDQENYVLDFSENTDSEISRASSGGTPRSSLSSSSSVQSDDDSTDLSKFESRAILSDEVRFSQFFFSQFLFS
jgi:hypothetical protein